MKRRFFRKFCILLFPYVLLLAVPVALAVYIGEAMPLKMVVSIQNQNDEVLFGPKDAEYDFAYKLFAVETRRPEVIVVGSSRIQQFRDKFFNKNPGTFYNFFMSAGRLTELQASALTLLKAEYRPKVLFMGLDLVWFNEDFVNWMGQRSTRTEEIGLNRVKEATRTVISQVTKSSASEIGRLMSRKEPLENLTALGLNAIFEGSGFRPDGSLRHPGIIQTNAEKLDTRLAPDLEYMKLGEHMYQEGTHISQAALEKIEQILSVARENDIEVIGLSMPFNSVISENLASDGKHLYLPKAVAKLDDLFRRYDFSYFYFPNPQSIGGSNYEMYDAGHSGELLSLRAYLVMLQALPEVLGQYSDVHYLESVAANAQNPFLIFDE